MPNYAEADLVAWRAAWYAPERSNQKWHLCLYDTRRFVALPLLGVAQEPQQYFQSVKGKDACRWHSKVHAHTACGCAATILDD